MNAKMKSLIILMAICGSFAISGVEQTAPKDGEVWAGISYLASRRGLRLRQDWPSMPLVLLMPLHGDLESEWWPVRPGV